MEVFDRVMTENGLTYFLYGGTLLGSYRHHGFVPWDDDLDVIVPDSLRNLTWKVLAKISPADYVLYFDFACYWKLFSPHWDSIDERPWRFPFLDIFFYQDNETHIWDACPDYKKYFTYAKSVVFPLRRRPFLNLSLLAPRDARAVIAQTYRIDVCQSNYFCHSLEKFVRYTKIPCSRLDSVHPFVRRTYMNGGCNETLVDQGNITKVFFDWGVSC
ncbi:unnamed protein product [Lymnaea stagnalis]|uniref:LicD/FKTN/FKRP nucleotidyltransferase domain-containing protein n=1 Tax=Lymnaea stagnalis TaxID=6523 RepID=A0AAV2H2V4_LYMST